MKGEKMIIEMLNSHFHCSSRHRDKCDIPLHLLGGACLMLAIRKIKPLKFLSCLWTVLSVTGWDYWVCPVQGQNKTSSQQTSVIISLQGEETWTGLQQVQAQTIRYRSKREVNVNRSILSMKKMEAEKHEKFSFFSRIFSCIWYLSQFNLFYVFLIAYCKMG